MHVVFLVLSLISFANSLVLAWMLVLNHIPQNSLESAKVFLFFSWSACFIGMIIFATLWPEKEVVEKDEE